MTDDQVQNFSRWKKCFDRFSQFDHVYIKLSGAFSEIGDQEANDPWPISKIVQRMKPWLDHIFRRFIPQRIMFGSDWPVCNVRGPGNAASWKHWFCVVSEILRIYNISVEEKDMVWWGTALKAYRLQENSS
jgi:L-rhamnono-1,4-lactonase